MSNPHKYDLAVQASQWSQCRSYRVFGAPWLLLLLLPLLLLVAAHV